MEVNLENSECSARFKSLGGEMCSLIRREDGTQYLWNGDPTWWKFSSPVLFPVVGNLVGAHYSFDGHEYSLPCHGFGRTSEYELVNKTEDSVTFELKYSEETLKSYPWKFRLQITYTLKGDTVEVSWKVDNLDDKEMFFQIGAHPAFLCPFVKGESFTDYYIEFAEDRNAQCYNITPQVLMQHDKRADVTDGKLTLDYEKFAGGVHIFDRIKGDKLSLVSSKSGRRVTIKADGFKFWGIWTPEKGGAPFICMEPWFGHADYADYNGAFKDREGTLSLKPGQSFTTSYQIITG